LRRERVTILARFVHFIPDNRTWAVSCSYIEHETAQWLRKRAIPRNDSPYVIPI